MSHFFSLCISDPSITLTNRVMSLEAAVHEGLVVTSSNPSSTSSSPGRAMFGSPSGGYRQRFEGGRERSSTSDVPCPQMGGDSVGGGAGRGMIFDAHINQSLQGDQRSRGNTPRGGIVSGNTMVRSGPGENSSIGGQGSQLQPSPALHRTRAQTSAIISPAAQGAVTRPPAQVGRRARGRGGRRGGGGGCEGQ